MFAQDKLDSTADIISQVMQDGEISCIESITRGRKLLQT